MCRRSWGRMWLGLNRVGKSCRCRNELLVEDFHRVPCQARMRWLQASRDISAARYHKITFSSENGVFRYNFVRLSFNAKFAYGLIRLGAHRTTPFLSLFTEVTNNTIFHLTIQREPPLLLFAFLGTEIIIL